jgi:hypothetical protein
LEESKESSDDLSDNSRKKEEQNKAKKFLSNIV